MFGIIGEAGVARKVFAWEDIYDQVEQAVILHSAFGRYRLNELELARVHSVGRLVARDVLIRLESLDILEKDERGRWSIVPLDRSRVEHLYEIRALLEPAALTGAAPQLPEGEVARMISTARACLDAYPYIPHPIMDTLETDLHVRTLSFSPNRELFRALERTRSVLIISKHVLGIAVELPAEDPFINEHLNVLTALARGDVRGAADLLRDHIVASAPKVIARVELFRTQSLRATAPYIL
jgi:DNA-binding GntR family transcriptional regulator